MNLKFVGLKTDSDHRSGSVLIKDAYVVHASMMFTLYKKQSKDKKEFAQKHMLNKQKTAF